MTKNSALFAGVTAIIIVALLGSYFYIGDDGDDAREYKVGDVTEFNVFGFAESGDPIRGTFKVVMLDVSDTQYYAEHTSDIYTIDGDGARTPWDVGTYEAWQDKLSSFDHDVKDLVTVDTYWGEDPAGLGIKDRRHVRPDRRHSVVCDGISRQSLRL